MVAQEKIEVFCWLPPSDHLRQGESNLAVNPFSVHKAIADSRAQMIQWLSRYKLQTFKCKLQSCMAMLHFASRTLSHIFDIKTQPTVNLTISQTNWLHQTGQFHCYHHILKQSLEQSESYSRELLTVLFLKHLIPEPSANMKNEPQKACCIKTLYWRSSYGLHVSNILHFLNFSAFTVGHVICTHM